MTWMVGVLFSAGLLVALVPVGSISLLIRALLAAAGLAGLIQPAAALPRNRTLSWWAVVLMALLGLSIVAVPFAVDQQLALQELARVFFLVTVTLGVTRGLTQPNARQFFVGGHALLTLVSGTIIIAIFVGHGGSLLDTLTGNSASLKTYAVSEFGISLNALTFACVLGLLAGVVPGRGWIRLTLAPLAIAAVALGGSRTSLLSLAIALPGCALLLAIHHQPRRIPAWVSYLSLAVAVAVLTTWLGSRVDRPQLDVSLLSEATTGRFDLWTAAVSMFGERPLTGWGPGSFSELVLPQLSASLASSLGPGVELSGAAHSAYLAVLAERGLLGFTGSLFMLVFLTATALRLFHGRRALAGVDRGIGVMAPVAVVAMMVRGIAEQPGLMGAADSLIDFMEFGVAALIVSAAASVPEAGGRDRLADR